MPACLFACLLVCLFVIYFGGISPSCLHNHSLSGTSLCDEQLSFVVELLRNATQLKIFRMVSSRVSPQGMLLLLRILVQKYGQEKFVIEVFE